MIYEELTLKTIVSRQGETGIDATVRTIGGYALDDESSEPAIFGSQVPDNLIRVQIVRLDNTDDDLRETTHFIFRGDTHRLIRKQRIGMTKYILTGEAQ